MKTVILTIAAALATVAFAKEPAVEGAKPERKAMRAPGSRSGDRMQMGMPMLEPILRMVANPQFAAKLGLAEDQVAKLQALVKGRTQDRDIQAKIRKCMDRQAELLKVDSIDEAAVMAAVDELFELRKTAMKEQIKRMIAAKAVLTPEQLAKAKALIGEFRGGRRQPKPDKGSQTDAPKPAAEPKAK